MARQLKVKVTGATPRFAAVRDGTLARNTPFRCPRTTRSGRHSSAGEFSGRRDPVAGIVSDVTLWLISSVDSGIRGFSSHIGFDSIAATNGGRSCTQHLGTLGTYLVRVLLPELADRLLHHEHSESGQGEGVVSESEIPQLMINGWQAEGGQQVDWTMVIYKQPVRTHGFFLLSARFCFEEGAGFHSRSPRG
jgi:hypothetical protein